MQKEKMDREIIYSSLSPNQAWNLVIFGPSNTSPNFYAHIRHVNSNESYGFPFGFKAMPNEFMAKWNLLQDICGLFIAQNCYGMFYYGTNHRNKPRYRARTSPKNPFTTELLAEFGKESLVNYEIWEGMYPIPDLHVGKCSWCRKNQSSFWVVLFEGVTETIGTQSEVICSFCVQSAFEFIKMRKQGYSRKSILKDFGIR